MFDGSMVVFPQAGGKQDWVANLRLNPELSVYSRDTRWAGSADFVRVEGLRDPVLGAFARKYGEPEVRKRYWGQLEYARILLRSSTPQDYLELVYSDLETAFDGVAESYDEHIMKNPMNLWLRDRSLKLMAKVFRPGDVVLEIGCGTGTETLALAKRGVRVIASDISSRMLDVLKRKAEAEGLRSRVVPIHCRPYEIMSRIRDEGYDSVDGAYSTYGAVNTEPRLDDMLSGLHQVIRPGGSLVLGVWNKFCIYELVGYAIRARPAMAVARLRNPVPVGRSRFCVTTNSFSVGSLDDIVRRRFTRVGLYGVEILLPPSNLVRYLPPGPLLNLVKTAESALEPTFPWNRLGDHFLAVYLRNE
jgi:ubiquinone/menaquinone biosynthesis C-methylase UbiE